MPKATNAIKYDHHELTALMVSDQGIKEGHWMIQASFSLAVINVVGEDGGPSGPGAVSVLAGLGIQEVDEPTPFTVDAAEVWAAEHPARRRKRRPAPAKAKLLAKKEHGNLHARKS